MNKDFEHIDRLIEEVKKDKAADGANSSILNRYPCLLYTSLPTSLNLYEQVRQHYTSLYPDLKFSVARNHESVLNYWAVSYTHLDVYKRQV